MLGRRQSSTKSEQIRSIYNPCSQQTLIFNATIRINVTLFVMSLLMKKNIDAITKNQAFLRFFTDIQMELIMAIDQAGSSLWWRTTSGKLVLRLFV